MFFNILIIIVLIYILYVLLLFLAQRLILFPGRSLGAADFQTNWIQAEQKYWIKTSSGKVETWFIKTNRKMNDSFRLIVIFAHGNYELIDFCQSETRALNQIGADVLLVEYPGYGRSEGSPSEESITEAYIKAYDWLIEQQGMNKVKIVGFGRSLGGGAICALAKQRELQALILQSTFSSVRSFSKNYLVPGFLVRDPFDNVELVRTFQKSLLIIHGRYDNVIPYHHGLTLAESNPQAKLITYDCEHTDCPPEQDEYWNTVAEFLSSLTAKP